MSPEYSKDGGFGLMNPPPVPGVSKKPKDKPLDILIPEYEKITAALIALNTSVGQAFKIITPLIAEQREYKSELKAHIDECFVTVSDLVIKAEIDTDKRIKNLFHAQEVEHRKFIQQENARLRAEVIRSNKDIRSAMEGMRQEFDQEIDIVRHEIQIKTRKWWRKVIVWFETPLGKKK